MMVNSKNNNNNLVLKLAIMVNEILIKMQYRFNFWFR